MEFAKSGSLSLDSNQKEEKIQYPDYSPENLKKLISKKENILTRDPNELNNAIQDCNLRVDKSPGQLVIGKLYFNF